MKKCQTFYEAPTPSRVKETIQFHIRQKLSKYLQQKFSSVDLKEYTDICFPSTSIMPFLEV